MFYQTLPPPLLAVVLKRWMHVFVVAAFLFCFFFVLSVCVRMFSTTTTLFQCTTQKRKEIRQFFLLSKV